MVFFWYIYSGVRIYGKCEKNDGIDKEKIVQNAKWITTATVVKEFLYKMWNPL